MINRPIHFSRRQALTALSGLTGVLALPGLAVADDFPSRPIKLVVSAAPGGGLDIIARLIAEPLAARIKQGVVVDNRAGGNGVIGGQAVANAQPDGYTLLMAFDGTMSIMPALDFKMGFDPFKDVVPITKLADAQAVLALHPSVEASSFAQLKKLSETKPLALAFAGAGSRAHLEGELLRSMGFNILLVPYRGGGPAMQDALAGQVQMVFTSVAAAKPHIVAGKLRGLAVSGVSRSKHFPDVPTYKEAGLDGFGDTSWYALYAPPLTPRSTLDYLNREVLAVLALPELRARMIELGLEARGGSPEDLTREMLAGRNKWSKVARDANLKISE